MKYTKGLSNLTLAVALAAVTGQKNDAQAQDIYSACPDGKCAKALPLFVEHPQTTVIVENHIQTTQPTYNGPTDPNGWYAVASREQTPVINYPQTPAQRFPMGKVLTAEHILTTGDLGIYDDTPQLNQFIDWNNNDEFNQAYRQILQSSIEAVGKDSVMQSLLAKPKWDRKDRYAWEEKLSQIIMDEVYKIPAFQTYRDAYVTPLNGREKLARSTYFNAISEDIRNGTEFYENDCEVQGCLKACLATQVEKHHLSASQDSYYKSPCQYLFVRGLLYTQIHQLVTGHAFVLTPTGNVIEGTVKPADKVSPYKIRDEAKTGPHDYINGNILYVSDKNAIYTRNLDMDEFESQLKKDNPNLVLKELAPY